MKILVDTHSFLWFVFGDSRISKRAEKLIQASESEVMLSIVSLWEMSIKASIGRLKLGMEFDRFVDDFILARRVGLLGLEIKHLKENAGLPWHHRDPFDRLLISQARSEALPILTNDSSFKSYGLRVLW